MEFHLVRFGFRMCDILSFKWFLPLKIQINSKKNQVLEGKISSGRGNTWANSTGHTSMVWYIQLKNRGMGMQWVCCNGYQHICYELGYQQVYVLTLISIMPPLMMHFWHNHKPDQPLNADICSHSHCRRSMTSCPMTEHHLWPNILLISFLSFLHFEWFKTLWER